MNSLMSKVAWLYLKSNGYQKKVSDPVRRRAYFEELREINSKPQEPSCKRIRSRIDKEIIEGVETFFLERGRNKVVLYLHGGSYCEQAVPQHWQLCDRIAQKTGATIIFPIYKMAPDYTFESAYEYLPALWKKILESVEPKNIILMGDSAGGGLALAFAEYLKKETDMPQPARLILFSPWLDLSMETEVPEKLAKIDPMLVRECLAEAGRNWAGDADIHDYRVSPMFGELKGLAPIAMFFGTHEIFITDARKFRDRCAGEEIDILYIEGEGMNHTYPLFPIPEAKAVQEYVFAVINGE